MNPRSTVHFWQHQRRQSFARSVLLALLCISPSSLLTQTAPSPKATQNNFHFTVTGVQNPSIIKNINARLSIFEQNEKNELPAAAITHLYHQGVQEIKIAVEPFGYFHTKITGELSLQANNQWQANYHVRLGPRLHITAIMTTLQGAGKHDPQYQNFLKTHMPKVGDPFINAKYELAKKQMLTYAFEHGYLNAQWVAHTIYIDRQQETCAITLTIKTGPQFAFGKATFKGGHLKQSFLKRYLNFSQGETYSEKVLRQFQQNLSGSGYFDSVQVHTKKNDANADNEAPIAIQLVPTQAKHYQIGGGWGTDTGIRGIATLQMNRFNSRGHKLLINLSGSERQESLQAQYIIPGNHPATQHYAISTSVTHEDNQQSESRLKSIGLSYSQIWHKFHLISAVNLQEGTSALAGQPTYRTVMLVPSVNVQWTHSNHPARPEQGHHVNLILQGASDDMLSDLDFFQTIFRFKTLQTLTDSGNQVLILSGAAGITLSDAQEKLPVDYQFYLGGSQSLRGYQYNSIGPGPNFLMGTVEMRQRIKGNLFAAIFTDVGNTGNSIHMSLKKDAGVGLVYQSMLGSFQLSVARALGENDHSLVISFNMGPEL